MSHRSPADAFYLCRLADTTTIHTVLDLPLRTMYESSTFALVPEKRAESGSSPNGTRLPFRAVPWEHGNTAPWEHGPMILACSSPHLFTHLSDFQLCALLNVLLSMTERGRKGNILRKGNTTTRMLIRSRSSSVSDSACAIADQARIHCHSLQITDS